MWAHSCGVREAAWLDEAQMVGAQAITGAFRTVATAAVEAEASIQPAWERHVQATTRFWINLREGMLRCSQIKMGNLSFLRGKAASNGDKWAPNMQTVQATIKFTMQWGGLTWTRSLRHTNYSDQILLISYNLILTDRALAAEVRMLNTWRNWSSRRPVMACTLDWTSQ